MKPRQLKYLNHQIELRQRGKKAELLIDGVPFRYGQLPDKQYFLHEYAYDTSDDLMEVARKFVAYRQKAEKIRRERKTGK